MFHHHPRRISQRTAWLRLSIASASIFFVSCATNPARESAEPHCYWMENYSGKYLWVDANAVYQRVLNKKDCYALDSCSGGLQMSGGGCYKWATSADAKPLPWN